MADQVGLCPTVWWQTRCVCMLYSVMADQMGVCISYSVEADEVDVYVIGMADQVGVLYSVIPNQETNSYEFSLQGVLVTNILKRFF